MAGSLKTGLCMGWGRWPAVLSYPPQDKRQRGHLGHANVLPSRLGIDQQPLTQPLEGD